MEATEFPANCNSGYWSSDPGVLVWATLIQFSKALEVLRKHPAEEYHQIAVV